MRTGSSSLLLSLLLACLLAAPPLSAQSSKQGQKREQLLEKLGLEKKPPEKKPREDEPSPEDAPSAEGTEENADDEPDARREQEGKKAHKPTPARVTFVPRVHALLVAECRSCHRAGKAAAKSGFALSDDAAADFAATKGFVGATPEKSPLFLEARGHKHGGGEILEENGAGTRLLSTWISQGAPYAAKETSPAATTAPVVKGEGAAETSTKKAVDESKASPTAATMTHDGKATTTEPRETTTEPRQTTAAAPSGPRFLDDIHPLLEQRCTACHEANGMAGESGYVFRGDPDDHYAAVRALVNPAAPSESLLLQRALGVEHQPVFDEGSPAATTLRAWIAAGARGPVTAAPLGAVAAEIASEDAGDDGAELPSSTSSKEPLVSPQPALDALAAAAPLLGTLRLHGRFDLSYERRGYTGDPLDEDAFDALRSYHHFLFLSRRSKSDPIGLDIELVTLQFWEASARHSFGPVDVGVKLGKILVPFGAEPLFHHSYGGLAGFDQRLLPIVWAQEGASAFASARLFGMSLAADLYAVRGHALRSDDAVLSLQADLSPIDDVKLATGGRLRFSVGPLSAWYSAYVNPLGFDRLLFLQAFDVGLWRWRGVPVLEDMAFSAGVLRGDVSGAGAGRDHYHFGSYLQARYYPFDFLYFQYRQGLRTFDNQRGLYLDPFRLTSEDASTHSVGAVLEWRGVYLGVWHFWNLEKVNELDDDFFRFTVGYAF